MEDVIAERDRLRAAVYDWLIANGPDGWIEKLRKDAERYRWIRNFAREREWQVYWEMDPEALDAAIDTELQQLPG
jgi:hypothetical protein